MRLALLFCTLFLITQADASLIYVDARNGNDVSGDGSMGTPFASMAKVFGTVAGGDTVLLQPGFYGDVEFDGSHGVGSDSTGWITYLADPATCTPRPQTWYEDSIPRPDTTGADGHVVFSKVKFDYYTSDLDRDAKTGTPDGHFIVLEGVNVVNGNVTLVSYVSHVVVRNCNVFGKWSDYSTKVTGTSFNLYRAYGLGSNYRHILVEGCYSTHCSSGAMLLGNFYNVTLRGCHFHHFCSSALRVNGTMDSVLIEGNHMHHQVALADYVKSRHAVTAVDGSEPGRIMTIESGGNYWDHATVIDATDGTVILSEVESYDNSTGRLVLAAALSFTVAAGDSVWLWDDTHGSGLAVRADNFTYRGNRIHGCGGSRGLYFYDRPYKDVIIENNLFYTTTNYTVDLHSYMDDGCKVINNTFAGTRHGNYYSNNEGGAAYGTAMIGAAPASGADPTTLVVANNVFVGNATAPAGGIVKNNIVFAGSGFEEDTEGDNSGNLVYYNDEPAGSEPAPFQQAAGFFVGGDGFDDGFLTRHQNNFNDYFTLAAGSDAIGFADPAYATAADAAGTARDGAPDAGCFEYKSSSVGQQVIGKATGMVRVFPNPMSAVAAINVPAGTETIRIYNMNGRLVRTILPRPAGANNPFDSAQDRHSPIQSGMGIEWNGTNTAGNTVPAGIYNYVVKTGSNSYTGKIFKIK